MQSANVKSCNICARLPRGSFHNMIYSATRLTAALSPASDKF